MNALAFQSFGFDDQLVRVLDQGGSPWFVASDVCACLGFSNNRESVSKLDEDEKMTVPVPTAGGVQRVIIISESGLYTLVFRCQDALTEGTVAWRFRRWVTGEVLPTLRRTGAYVMPPANGDPAGEDLLEDERRIMLGLAIVREARMVFGRPAARRLWHRAGLPVVEADEQARLIEHGGDHAIPEDFLVWIRERTVEERGARTESDALYQDYMHWCRETERHAMSQADFGRNFRRHGFPPFRSNGIWRIGIRLAVPA